MLERVVELALSSETFCIETWLASPGSGLVFGVHSVAGFAGVCGWLRRGLALCSVFTERIASMLPIGDDRAFDGSFFYCAAV
jgi:hypothetical protein